MQSLLTRPLFVGNSPFDDLFKLVAEPSQRFIGSVCAPDYRVFSENEDTVIAVNAAGFDKAEIDISATETHLVIKGTHTDSGENHIVDDFELKFKIPQGKELETKAASLENGILKLILSFNIPEKDKPKVIKLD